MGSLCPDRILLRYRQEASADARHQEKRVPADHPLQKVRTLVEVFGEMSAGHASAGVLLVNCVTFFTTAHPTYDATYKTSYS